MEELKFFASLGVGGVLAGAIFLFYRKDVLSKQAECQRREALVIEVVKTNAISGERLAESIRNLQGFLDKAEAARGQQFSDLVRELRDK